MIEDRVAALDTGLFAHVESQTSEPDRRSLLALQNAIARDGGFSYLEIGSHLGGTLQPMVADPRCTRIVSIDPRPQWQPDDRTDLDGCDYPDNSTERMLGLLRGVPGADLSKLETIEESTENLPPDRFGRPNLCFIDGEHTYDAALRDARFCRAVIHGKGIIAFHDSHTVERAILTFLRETPRPHRAYSLKQSVFVVELGSCPSALPEANVRRQLYRPRQAWIVANRFGADTPLVAADIRVLDAARPALHAIRWRTQPRVSGSA